MAGTPWKDMGSAPKGEEIWLLMMARAVIGGVRLQPVVGHWSSGGWRTALIDTGVPRQMEWDIEPACWTEIPEYSPSK